jgi:prepilin-type N-terminal cleavage/methylation domain-containing protein
MKRNRKGFTLVEMMIVVLIIGILVTIALPNFLKAREMAQSRACAANMKTIQAAVETWAMATRAKPSDSLPDINDLVNAGYLKVLPRCPAGGTYSISGNVANYDVECSVHKSLTNAMGSL